MMINADISRKISDLSANKNLSAESFIHFHFISLFI